MREFKIFKWAVGGVEKRRRIYIWNIVIWRLSVDRPEEVEMEPSGGTAGSGGGALDQRRGSRGVMAVQCEGPACPGSDRFLGFGSARCR
ncbi:hypothetical protein NPIL_388771 [Nephila pilipes]|uniref:Uncharacterized protein n=1 Tax=Nephila pilipes TaxID=299642 RepID=A0A8X6MPQ3_NEPPI|nr:hypothetical protein NPIL_388771 [Nephila pilipes]